MVRNDFSNFGRGWPKKHFYEIILKSDYWSRRRCHLKVFYFQLWQPFCSVERSDFSNFGRGSPKWTFLWNYFEIGPLLKEMSFEEIVDGRTDDGQISITIAHLEHLVLRWANYKRNGTWNTYKGKLWFSQTNNSFPNNLTLLFMLLLLVEHGGVFDHLLCEWCFQFR